MQWAAVGFKCDGGGRQASLKTGPRSRFTGQSRFLRQDGCCRGTLHGVSQITMDCYRQRRQCFCWPSPDLAPEGKGGDGHRANTAVQPKPASAKPLLVCVVLLRRPRVRHVYKGARQTMMGLGGVDAPRRQRDMQPPRDGSEVLFSCPVLCSRTSLRSKVGAGTTAWEVLAHLNQAQL